MSGLGERATAQAQRCWAAIYGDDVLLLSPPGMGLVVTGWVTNACCCSSTHPSGPTLGTGTAAVSAVRDPATLVRRSRRTPVHVSARHHWSGLVEQAINTLLAYRPRSRLSPAVAVDRQDPKNPTSLDSPPPRRHADHCHTHLPQSVHAAQNPTPTTTPACPDNRAQNLQPHHD